MAGIRVIDNKTLCISSKFKIRAFDNNIVLSKDSSIVNIRKDENTIIIGEKNKGILIELLRDNMPMYTVWSDTFKEGDSLSTFKTAWETAYNNYSVNDNQIKGVIKNVPTNQKLIEAINEGKEKWTMYFMVESIENKAKVTVNYVRYNKTWRIDTSYVNLNTTYTFNDLTKSYDSGYGRYIYHVYDESKHGVSGTDKITVNGDIVIRVEEVLLPAYVDPSDYDTIVKANITINGSSFTWSVTADDKSYSNSGSGNIINGSGSGFTDSNIQNNFKRLVMAASSLGQLNSVNTKHDTDDAGWSVGITMNGITEVSKDSSGEFIKNLEFRNFYDMSIGINPNRFTSVTLVFYAYKR